MEDHVYSMLIVCPPNRSVYLPFASVDKTSVEMGWQCGPLCFSLEPGPTLVNPYHNTDSKDRKATNNIKTKQNRSFPFEESWSN